jgi:hypothetical protein
VKDVVEVSAALGYCRNIFVLDGAMHCRKFFQECSYRSQDFYFEGLKFLKMLTSRYSLRVNVVTDE